MQQVLPVHNIYIFDACKTFFRRMNEKHKKIYMLCEKK